MFPDMGEKTVISIVLQNMLKTISDGDLLDQRAKKVVSDSPGLVDFAIGLVIFVLNLPDGQVLFFGEIQITKDCNQSC